MVVPSLNLQPDTKALGCTQVCNLLEVPPLGCTQIAPSSQSPYSQEKDLATWLSQEFPDHKCFLQVLVLYLVYQLATTQKQ